MFNFKKILGCVATVAIFSFQTHASTLVLDGFNYDTALALEVDPTNSTDMDGRQSLESGALANYTLTWLSGAATNTAKANRFGSSVLGYGEEPGAQGSLEIAYTMPGGITLDFTGYTDFFFDVNYIDGSGGFDVVLTLTDFDNTAISATYNVSNEGRFLASFNQMMAGTDFDFSQVASATAFISSVGAGDDFSLDAVGLVPEPAALALLGLGLVGLGLRRRKLV